MSDHRTPCRDCFSAATEPAPVQVCPGCHGEFVCDLAQGKSRCWCMELPAVLPLRAGAECLCEACLKRAIQNIQTRPDGTTETFVGTVETAIDDGGEETGSGRRS